MICYDTTEDIDEGTNECAKKEKNFLMKRNKCEFKKNAYLDNETVVRYVVEK